MNRKQPSFLIDTRLPDDADFGADPDEVRHERFHEGLLAYLETVGFHSDHGSCQDAYKNDSILRSRAQHELCDARVDLRTTQKSKSGTLSATLTVPLSTDVDIEIRINSTDIVWVVSNTDVFVDPERLTALDDTLIDLITLLRIKQENQ